MSRDASLAVECRLENLRVLAAAVRRIATPILGAVATDQLDVALTELCSNIIRHGHRNRPSAMLHVGVRGHADRVEVELRDQGPAFIAEPPAMPSVEVALEDLPEGGFGLAIVAATMDEFAQRRDGDTNVTRIVKRRP